MPLEVAVYFQTLDNALAAPLSKELDGALTYSNFTLLCFLPLHCSVRKEIKHYVSVFSLFLLIFVCFNVAVSNLYCATSN
jgi:hypothetical protein